VGQYREEILKVLTEPRTPNEVAGMVKCNQHTAQNELLELALAGVLKHKKVGRSHIFWSD
jgi:predicted Zn-ribbon and HTH transcriptional regulator